MGQGYGTRAFGQGMEQSMRQGMGQGHGKGMGLWTRVGDKV